MKIEIRSQNEAIIEGYVNAVERDSRLLPRNMCPSAAGSFYERVRAGVFRRSLESGKEVQLMHNHSRVIGGTKSNLELREDNIGLYAHAIVTDPAVISKAAAGELRGWSFGFNCTKDDWEDVSEGIQRRNLDEIDLLEVTIIDSTATPAYIGTSIEMRGEDCTALEWRGTEEENIICEAASSDTDGGKNAPAQPTDPVMELNRKRFEALKMRGELNG